MAENEHSAEDDAPVTGDNWNPNTMTPACDWCGECDWCQNLGRVLPPAADQGGTDA